MKYGFIRRAVETAFNVANHRSSDPAERLRLRIVERS